MDRLPGHVRQRVRRAVIGLRENPRPADGLPLGIDLGAGRELWRLRIDAWRVIYLIDSNWDRVYVLAARRRPPYQYEDLESLLTEVE